MLLFCFYEFALPRLPPYKDAVGLQRKIKMKEQSVPLLLWLLYHQRKEGAVKGEKERESVYFNVKGDNVGRACEGIHACKDLEKQRKGTEIERKPRRGNNPKKKRQILMEQFMQGLASKPCLPTQKERSKTRGTTHQMLKCPWPGLSSILLPVYCKPELEFLKLA